jgi:hypothetical protein
MAPPTVLSLVVDGTSVLDIGVLVLPKAYLVGNLD